MYDCTRDPKSLYVWLLESYKAPGQYYTARLKNGKTRQTTVCEILDVIRVASECGYSDNEIYYGLKVHHGLDLNEIVAESHRRNKRRR